MRKPLPVAVYTDGGCVGRNPSPLGGTWAWCWVGPENELLKEASGVITPEDVGLPTVSCNISELFAVLRALMSLPPDWSGLLCTDSKITLLRVTSGSGFKGVPNWMRLRALKLRRGRKWQAQLCKGHAKPAELEAGWSGGRLTSKWNNYVDAECTRLAKAFKERLGL